MYIYYIPWDPRFSPPMCTDTLSNQVNFIVMGTLSGSNTAKESYFHDTKKKKKCVYLEVRLGECVWQQKVAVKFQSKWI